MIVTLKCVFDNSADGREEYEGLLEDLLDYLD